MVIYVHQQAIKHKTKKEKIMTQEDLEVLPRNIAKFLITKEHKLNITFCCHDKDKEEMTAMISVQDERGEVVLKPFCQTGDYASFNGVDASGQPVKYMNGKGGLWQSVFSMELLIREANSLKALASEIEKKKKDLKAEEEKLKKAPKVNANRCAGTVDSDIASTLVSIPATDVSYKKALEEANLQTLFLAIDKTKTTKGAKSKFAKLSSEIKKITGCTAEDMGHTYAPEECVKQTTESTTESTTEATEATEEKAEENNPQLVMFNQGE